MDFQYKDFIMFLYPGRFTMALSKITGMDIYSIGYMALPRLRLQRQTTPMACYSDVCIRLTVHPGAWSTACLGFHPLSLSRVTTRSSSRWSTALSGCPTALSRWVIGGLLVDSVAWVSRPLSRWLARVVGGRPRCGSATPCSRLACTVVFRAAG